MSYILHIDTSGNTGTVAIARDGILLATETTSDNRNQASLINVMIAQVLAVAGIGTTDLSAVAVCGGPGSYTGLRIGMATAKGLCYALDIPMLADNKLTLLAGGLYQNTAQKEGLFVALLLAREKEYFITMHDAHFNCMMAPMHIFEKDILFAENEALHLVTDIEEDELRKFASGNISINNNITIDLKYWCFMAAQAYDHHRFVNLSYAEPFYLKEVYTHK